MIAGRIRGARERRRAERLNIPIQIKYKLLPYKRILQETFSQNISGSGLKLSLGSPLKKGDRLKTLLYFPGDPKPVTAFSKVVWCTGKIKKKRKSFEVGIKHIKIFHKDRERFVFLFCEMMINYFILGKK